MEGNIYQAPSHAGCTYLLPRPSRVRQEPLHPATPRWLTEHTHSCWCSSWKLLASGEWRVWRKGRWLRPAPREVRLRWVWEADGDKMPITGKQAKVLLAKIKEE